MTDTTDTKQELIAKLMQIVFGKYLVDPEVYPKQFAYQRYMIERQLDMYKEEYAEQLAAFETPKLENSST